MARTVVVHVNDPDGYEVYIGRAVPRRGLAASPFANPFPIERGRPRAQALRLYRPYIEERLCRDDDLRTQLRALQGKRIACWCKGTEGTRDVPCHGDVVADLADAMVEAGGAG